MLDQPTTQALKDLDTPVVRVVTVTEFALPDAQRVVRAAVLAGWTPNVDLEALPNASAQQQVRVAAAALEWLVGGGEAPAGAVVVARLVQAQRLNAAHGHHLHHGGDHLRDLTDQVLNV